MYELHIMEQIKIITHTTSVINSGLRAVNWIDLSYSINYFFAFQLGSQISGGSLY